MIKRQLLNACAGTAVMVAMAAPAYAQDTPQQTSGNEIVVTAQGREQALADVPIAVNVVNADTLQQTGASDIRQLNQVVPSLLVSSTGSEANGSARIRGIGTVGDNPGLESSVAVFIDGVYRSRSGIGLNELGDIDRIEVLRGPQGTLFGRNASAGLISIHSKAPNTNGLSGGGDISYGNYDYWRLSGFVNVPLSDTIAARVDAVYVKRDGFYNDVNNRTDINNRDRFFVRGQLQFEPSSDVTIRLIGDYTQRNERCCTAVYVNDSVAPLNSALLTDTNPVIPVLRSLGQPDIAYADPYSRNVYLTPGRSYAGSTTDWGFSGQVDWDFGGASLTSITAYRFYKNAQGADTDYGRPDLIFSAADEQNFRRFRTFSQELRLQGEAFDGTLDWLIGGYYANEELTVQSNLRFGNDYGPFAACRLVAAVSPADALRNPTLPGCLTPAGRATLTGAFGAAAPLILAGYDRLSTVRNVGSINDVYRQESSNWALFTHNIIHITEGLDLTIGLRYTNERKRFNARFGNDNTACGPQQASLTPLLGNAAIASIAGGLISLACQGNSTSELNGVAINDRRSESEFTGTAVLSYKVTPDLLLYASYSRGYKAGGFNLDRSALKSPIAPFAATPGGAQALVGNLQFDPEINTAFEIGLKYSTRAFSLNISAFRQEFDNFQLNTFNGSVFLVQTVQGCKNDLAGADRDLSATTGACPADRTQAGVISQGVEIESTIIPARDVRISFGVSLVDTSYRNNLVANGRGVPLDPALRLLPGDNLSNAPRVTVTSSLAWTPELNSSGLSALFYVDGRLTSDYNTGSDLFPTKEQDGYFVMNARVGLRGPDQRWSIELWAQNLTNTNYTQVSFNTPFQATTSGPATGALATAYPANFYPAGTQIFSAFLAEPRTFGVTGRFRF